MELHEIEMLEKLNESVLLHSDPDQLIKKILNNERGLYNGHDFLLALSKKLPELFKVLFDDGRTDIPEEVYVSAAIHSEGGYLLRYFNGSNRFQNNLNLDEHLPKIFEKHWNALLHWPKLSKDEKWVERSAVKHYGAFQFASKELKDSKEFVTKLIIQRPDTFKYASVNCRNDLKIAALAVILDVNNFPFVGIDAARNFEICFHAVSKNPNYIQRIDPKTPKFNQLLELAISLNPESKYLLAKEVYDAKAALNQIQRKANLELAFGSTPARISNLKDSETYLQRGKLNVSLVHQGRLKSFRLSIQKLNSISKGEKTVNINLNDGSEDSEEFEKWQRTITEEGALKIIISNVGIT